MFLYKLIPASVFSRQARKPSGLLGRWVMSRVFASGNRDLNDLVLSELALTEKDKVRSWALGQGIC